MVQRIAESELIINNDGSIFHLHVKPEELADKVILVGDPGRVELVASFFDTIEVRKSSREFNTITGTYNGKRISVISTGIGCDNIDIVMTELDALANVDFASRHEKAIKKELSIVRIGTSGAIQPDIPVGSYVFSEISVGFDGLLNWYSGRNDVAMVDYEEAFLKQVQWDRHLPIPYFVKASEKLVSLFRGEAILGMTISASGFYGPQCRVIRLPLVNANLMEQLEKYRFNDKRITNFEMESSAIASLAAKMGHSAGTVCLIIANRYAGASNPDYKPLMNNLIKLTLDKLTK